ncbi:MAG: DUF177 domain-containing protein [Dehalococcoidia bacterium]
MLYNVSQLLREPVGASRTFPIDDTLPLPSDDSAPVPVRGSVTLLRTQRGLLARARATVTWPDSCSRCLKPAEAILDLEVEEEYLPTVDPVTGAPLADPEDPVAFRIDAAHHLALDEAIRQAAVMAAPMQPLCRPDCRGLCPECGVDRNTAPCACETAPIDERWAGLRAIETGDAERSSGRN